VADCSRCVKQQYRKRSIANGEQPRYDPIFVVKWTINGKRCCVCRSDNVFHVMIQHSQNGQVYLKPSSAFDTLDVCMISTKLLQHAESANCENAILESARLSIIMRC